MKLGKNGTIECKRTGHLGFPCSSHLRVVWLDAMPLRGLRTANQWYNMLCLTVAHGEGHQLQGFGSFKSRQRQATFRASRSSGRCSALPSPLCLSRLRRFFFLLHGARWLRPSDPLRKRMFVGEISLVGVLPEFPFALWPQKVGCLVLGGSQPSVP